MTCELFCMMVPEDHRYASSRAVSACMCKTHQWNFPTGMPIANGSLCPIGRIEQAVEDGIDRFKRETAGVKPASIEGLKLR